jgi:hypothetical protein
MAITTPVAIGRPSGHRTVLGSLAMGPSRRRKRRVVSAVVTVVLTTWMILGTVGAAATESPEPPVIDPGDPRSEGEGPGLVGLPLLAAAAVIGLGVLAAGATVVVVRLSRED